MRIRAPISRKRIPVAAMLLWVTMFVPASARLVEVPGPIGRAYVDAVHRPTGCMARLEYMQDWISAAYIIDENCLPPGVKMRRVPLFLEDFQVPARYRERFRRP